MELETLVATLLATVVGGLLSLIGGVYVARRENRRAAWIRLLDEYLPQFEPAMPVMIAHGDPAHPELSFYAYARFEDLLQAMRRTARLAGKETQRLVSEVESAIKLLNRDLDPEEHRRVFAMPADGRDEAAPSDPVRHDDANTRLRELRSSDFDCACKALARLEKHLCRKLNLRGERWWERLSRA